MYSMNHFEDKVNFTTINLLASFIRHHFFFFWPNLDRDDKVEGKKQSRDLQHWSIDKEKGCS